MHIITRYKKYCLEWTEIIKLLKYFTYKITKQGTSLHFEIERANSINIYDKTMSVANNYKGIAFGLATESGESNSSYYIKEIKIEAL